jgi:hypothetical protein
MFNYIGEGFVTIFYHEPTPTIPLFSIVVQTGSNNVVTLFSVEYIVMAQEYKSISSWSSINRILIISNKLPIRREFYPVANTNGINATSISPYADLVSVNIIQSFLISSTNAGDYRTNIVYSASTVDNSDLIDMASTGAIREIDIEVHWSDKYGNMFPLLLQRNKQVDIRLAFVKK